MALLFQCGHFVEENLYEFYARFPEVLGLTPWPKEFFVAFNLAWLALWLTAILSISKYGRASALPLWFLAIASMTNGIAHPLLSLDVAGYFPGLWSSPFVGMLGAMLFGSLIAATGTRSKNQRAQAPPSRPADHRRR